MTVTVFPPLLSLIHTRYHLFLQSTQAAGFSRSLIILGSFPLDSLPLLTILLKVSQIGNSAAESKQGCVEQKDSFTCLSSYACLYIPAKKKNMGQQIEIIDLFSHVDPALPNCLVYVMYLCRWLALPRCTTQYFLQTNNTLASSLSRLVCIQGLPWSKYSCSPFWVSIICIISIPSSVNENTKPRTAPVESHLMRPSIFSLPVGFRSDQYFVDPVLMPGQERTILHKILTQPLFFSASIVSYNTTNNKAMKSLPPAVSQRNLPKG